MTNKTENIKIRITPSEREQLEKLAADKGFISKAGNAKLSGYVRWVLEHGEKPIDRSSYGEIKSSMQSVIRIGTLLNQLLYQTHKERKILDSDGYSDQSNIHFEKRLDKLSSAVSELSDELYLVKSKLKNLTYLESA